MVLRSSDGFQCDQLPGLTSPATSLVGTKDVFFAFDGLNRY